MLVFVINGFILLFVVLRRGRLILFILIVVLILVLGTLYIRQLFCHAFFLTLSPCLCSATNSRTAHAPQATFGHPGPGHVPTHCLTHCEEGMHRLAADVEGRNMMSPRITGNVSRFGGARANLRPISFSSAKMVLLYCHVTFYSRTHLIYCKMSSNFCLPKHGGVGYERKNTAVHGPGQSGIGSGRPDPMVTVTRPNP